MSRATCYEGFCENENRESEGIFNTLFLIGVGLVVAVIISLTVLNAGAGIDASYLQYLDTGF
ncbi:MAG: hypothetical protein P4N59_08835 [Negativicutes bacterium]|nr:hypothetical protein [Negativicutes bacterium]